MPDGAEAGPTEKLNLDILPDLLGYQLRRAQTLVYAGFADRLAKEGLTHAQFGLLILVGANPGSTQSALAEVFGINRSVIVRLIDRLEEAGLVTRTARKRDRRSNAIALTAKGEAVLARMREAVREHEAAVAGHLSEAELATLMRLLVRLAGP